jgi:hypothetical protein
MKLSTEWKYIIDRTCTYLGFFRGHDPSPSRGRPPTEKGRSELD